MAKRARLLIITGSALLLVLIAVALLIGSANKILKGQIEPAEAMFYLDIDNLAFLACGSIAENPSELLASDNMRKFLANMRAQFDYVLIDTPPIISVTDSGIVGALAEGVLLVIQAGRTQRGIVKRAVELLYQAHAKIIGHVLTNIEYHLPEYIYRYL